MASVVVPYKSSDGNSPYTETQLKELWKGLEPQAREPAKYTPQERMLLQREFLTYIQQGYSPTRACAKLKELASREPDKWPYATYGVFMAWKKFDKDFSEAYEIAYSMGTDELEDKAVEMAYGGNASMLQFLLKMRNPQRYVPRQETVNTTQGEVEHVHRVEIVAAKSKPLEIETDAVRGPSRPTMERVDYVDAEVFEVSRDD